MNIEREFIERRGEERRKLIANGIRAIHERRESDRRAANSRISAWIDKFERARNKSL